jgi:hypothetical protein
LRRISCLKVLTALVTKTSLREIPAASDAESRIRPAGPTNGWPASIIGASAGPLPGITWVAN